jgi:hypothetical protein
MFIPFSVFILISSLLVEIVPWVSIPVVKKIIAEIDYSRVLKMSKNSPLLDRAFLYPVSFHFNSIPLSEPSRSGNAGRVSSYPQDETGEGRLDLRLQRFQNREGSNNLMLQMLKMYVVLNFKL